jgi:hypothetical protein
LQDLDLRPSKKGSPLAVAERFMHEFPQGEHGLTIHGLSAPTSLMSGMKC